MITELADDIARHTGVFQCSQIGQESNERRIGFAHRWTAGVDTGAEPAPGVREFYAVFGSLVLYQDPNTEDAAYRIAPPEEWAVLEESFRAWIEDIDEENEDGLLPTWINSCIVVGEIPASGNYLIIPATGDEAGHVFEFDHDGFEFTDRAPSLALFARQALDPTPEMLVGMASHLRFVDAEGRQWWIESMTDTRGNAVCT